MENSGYLISDGNIDSIRRISFQYTGSRLQFVIRHMPRNLRKIAWPCFLLLMLGNTVIFAQSSLKQTILKIQEQLQQNNAEAARQMLHQAARKYPGDAGLDNLRGVLEAQQKNFTAAESAFRRAVRISPKFTGAWLNLGRLYQEQVSQDAAHLNKAVQTYLRVLQYDPANAEASFQCAMLRMLRGEYQASLLHLARLPEDLQSSPQSVAVLCADYAGIRDRTRAMEAASFLLTHTQLTEADVAAILPALDKLSDEELTLRLLEGLHQRSLASADSLHRLGLLHEKAGRLTEARTILEKAATTDRPSVTLLIDLARVAQRTQDHQSALGYLAHARDLEPQNARIHYLFGVVCAEMNLAGEAHASLSKAVNLEADNADYNYAMGILCTFRREPTEALPYLQKYQRLRPDDTQGHLWTGIAHFRSKNFAEAQKEFAAALSGKATQASARYYLGSIARQENRFDEAERELQAALKLQPAYADAHAELGQCYLQQRKHEMAAIHLHRAIEIDANHFTANFQLLTLYTRISDPRREKQNERFEEIKKRREERAQESMRGIEFKPQ
jgi:tetratricopeptide (TPR) repeat protein